MQRFMSHNFKRLTPLFTKTIRNAEKYMAMSPLQRQELKERKREAAKRRVYLKIPFHPSDPPRCLLQRLWHKHVARPTGKLPLNQLNTYNLSGDNEQTKVPIDQLIIAYRRAPNLGNIFSYRNIANREGPLVSSFIDT